MMVIQARKATSWKDKIIGLIGKTKIEPLYFETHFGIHTFGVKKPIDVIILDNEDRVKTLKHSLQPNHIFFWNPRYKKVIELPSGTIEKLNIQIHQKVTIKG